MLGQHYKIIIANETEYPKLKHCDGYCDDTIKQCVVKDFVEDETSKQNLEDYQKKVVRHELIHAFLFESGLSINSDWAINEEMIDWIALQFPKLLKAFKEINCL